MALMDFFILNRVRGLDASDIVCIAEHLVETDVLLTQPKVTLKKLRLSDNILKQLEDLDIKTIENELEWTQQPNHHVVTLFDDNYPQLLKELHKPPLLLFVKGDVSCLNKPQLAMVGSRNPTPLGQETAEQFAAYLARQGLVITSGLAIGIDAASHRGAIKAGQTIAVLGTGFATIYPRQNMQLAEEIVAHGAIVSEFPLDMPPKKENFPQRNRIISGLSLGVLVVEAAIHSGSLITAKWAINQGREVFAMPGSIHNPMARGCHHLIREGAKLVETAENVLEELKLAELFSEQPKLEAKPTIANLSGKNQRDTKVTANKIPNNGQIQQNKTAENRRIPLDDDYLNLLSCISFEVTAVDTIITRSGLSPEVVSSMLLLLELQGYIASVPGGYCRIRK